MEEFNQPKKRKPIAAVIGGYELLNMDVLSKCVWPFLSIKDVNSASLVCTEWKDTIYQSDEIWEGLIVQLYPSHKRIPTGWCTNGRQEYLRRIRLMKNQYMPVRDLEGLPVPLQLKTPGDVLLDRWNIKEERDAEIIIMVDVFTGRNHFDDDPPYETTTVIDDIPSLTNLTPIKSTLGRHVHICSSSAVANTGSTLIKFVEERQLPSEVTCEASAAIKYVQDKFKNIDLLAGRDGLYVEMNYYISGKSVPSHNPIPLLSEHHTFFSYDEEDDNDNNVNLPGSTYRTDISSCWLPNHRDLGKSTVPHCDNQQKAIAKTRISTRHYTRYGNVPLPFDPEITVELSPVGKLFVKPENYSWSNSIPFENDNADICSVFVSTGFSIDQEEKLNFKEFVLPSLLSLWNDASRYSKRRR